MNRDHPRRRTSGLPETLLVAIALVQWLQQGRLTLYPVYIFLTTVAALVWALAWPYLP
jgi:hypothetical protein